jgi:hypothetical protein
MAKKKRRMEAVAAAANTRYPLRHASFRALVVTAVMASNFKTFSRRL